ncbi:1,2-dihydroxy-3-keto-5-methylthiopentene dioxygenase [Marasmius crinis-equi]|uniref:1,2-dihydroxy-3-keto-5-methylthiopentene dioxygenase n=1 Tax=Marasmius crinis-equi TaxID=585013 RepID=A0ABR3FA37_9AGAR
MSEIRAFYHSLADGPHTEDVSRPVPLDVIRALGYQFWKTTPDEVVDELTKKAKERGFHQSATDSQVVIDFGLDAFGGDKEALEKEKAKFAEYFTWGHDVVICALSGQKIVYLEDPSQSDPDTVIRYVHTPGDCVLGPAGAFRQVFYIGDNKDLVLANVLTDEKPLFISAKDAENHPVRQKYLSSIGR